MRACVPTPCHRPPSPEVPVVVLGVDVDTLVGEQQLDNLGFAQLRRADQLVVDVETLVGEQQLGHLGMAIARRPVQSRPTAAERRTALHAQQANAARHQTACWRARTRMRMRGPNMPPSNVPI